MLSIYCKIALLFLFPSLTYPPFGNLERRACALRRVSGRVYLEPRKTNVRRAGERFDMHKRDFKIERARRPSFIWSHKYEFRPK